IVLLPACHFSCSRGMVALTNQQSGFAEAIRSKGATSFLALALFSLYGRKVGIPWDTLGSIGISGGWGRVPCDFGAGIGVSPSANNKRLRLQGQKYPHLIPGNCRIWRSIPTAPKLSEKQASIKNCRRIAKMKKRKYKSMERSLELVQIVGDLAAG